MWSETLFEQRASTFALSTSWSSDILWHCFSFNSFLEDSTSPIDPAIPRDSKTLAAVWSQHFAATAPYRIQTWMEKCDERLQRFSALSETLEIHRGDTQQSVMKLEELGGMVLKRVGISVPNFRALKGIQKDAKRTSGTRGTAMGCTVCLSASESGPQLRDRHCWSQYMLIQICRCTNGLAHLCCKFVGILSILLVEVQLCHIFYS